MPEVRRCETRTVAIFSRQPVFTPSGSPITSVGDVNRRRSKILPKNSVSIGIWFGGKDRSEESMNLFFDEIGSIKSGRIRLSLMDMWKPFEKSTRRKAPQSAILYDKFHVMRHLSEALDKVRKSEYAKLTGKDRKFIKGQKVLRQLESITQMAAAQTL
jgi:Transposase